LRLHGDARSRTLLAGVAALLFAAAPTRADAENAEQTFAQECAYCHGARLEGGRAAGLVKEVWLYGGDPASIADSIRGGRPSDGMPAFRDALTDGEIGELAAFIRVKADEAQRSSRRGASGAEPELALQYDFYDVQASQVPDSSGRDHTGTIVAGRIVDGRRKPAIQLEGTGVVTTDSLTRDVDLAGRAMSVGAMCKPSAPDGVIVSMGDAADGFSLYLQEGVPHFAVRIKGEIHEVAGTDPIQVDQWSHVAGVIGEEGGLALLVDTWTVAAVKRPSFLARTPAGPFMVGGDASTPAATSRRWHGLLEDVRLYWGAISRNTHHELLGDWADRPGCGCHR